MATKTIFTIDGSAITNAFSNMINYVKDTRFKIMSKEEKKIADMPLFLALILGIIFPVLTVTVLIVALVLSYKLTVEKNSKSTLLIIDKK